MIATRMIALSAFAILPALGRVTSLAARDTCDGGSGTVLCCSFLASANSPLVAPILASLGIVPGSLNGLVGVTCEPLEGNDSCGGQRACCVNNDFNGVVALDCTTA